MWAKWRVDVPDKPMKRDVIDNEKIRRYLLGEAGETDSTDIELQFLSNDAFFEEVAAHEDELYLEYAAGEMPASERNLFERRFLSDDRGRQRLAFATTFAEMIEDLSAARPTRDAVTEVKPGFLAGIAALFSLASSLRLAAGAAAILLVFGLAFMVLQDRRSVDEQAALDNTVPEPRPNVEGNTGAELPGPLPANNAPMKPPVNGRDAPPSPRAEAPRRSMLALLLSPAGAVRGGGPAARRIVLTGDESRVALTLNLPAGDDLQAYRVIVRSVDDDREVFSSTVKRKGARIMFGIPSGLLETADYEISLYAVEDGQVGGETATYYFSATRRGAPRR